MPVQLADDDDADIVPEVDLWCAALSRAWIDAFTPPTARPSQAQRSSVRDQAEARLWFERGCSDFRFVTECAGFDADAVRSRFRAQLALEETLERARAA